MTFYWALMHKFCSFIFEICITFTAIIQRALSRNGIKISTATSISICLLIVSFQDQALATFNFLNAEKRYVAGAFIPPSYVHAYEDDDIHKNVPSDVDPGVIPEKEFEGLEDDDLKPILEEGQKRLAELQEKSGEQENRGRQD
jgi:hypothetical protein